MSVTAADFAVPEIGDCEPSGRSLLCHSDIRTRTSHARSFSSERRKWRSVCGSAYLCVPAGNFFATDERRSAAIRS
jgi:hypothetical protein